MADVSVTEQLPVKVGQEYRVKLGKSFTFPEENAYHTIKYDFKPLSVDLTKPGKLKVADDEVNVMLPLAQAESTDVVAQFRGPKKACTKECVLSIDTASGEAVLERISNTIQLKAIRDGGPHRDSGRRSTNPQDRSISPFQYSAITNQTKAQQTPPNKLPPSTSSSSLSAANSLPPTLPTTATPSRTQKRPIKTNIQKSLPVKQDLISGQAQHSTNGSVENKKGAKKAAKKVMMVKNEPTVMSVQSSAVTNPSSFANMGSGLSMPAFSIPPTANQTSELPVNSNIPSHLLPAENRNQLSSKRIKLSSSSSSSSSSEDSNSEPEDSVSHGSQVLSHVTQAPPTQPLGGIVQPNTQLSHDMNPLANVYGGHTLVVGHRPQQSARQHTSSSSSSDSSDSSSGSSSSDSSSDSSDQDINKEVASAFSNQPQNNFRSRTMSQLRTDLHLSDSGSDSDS